MGMAVPIHDVVIVEHRFGPVGIVLAIWGVPRHHAWRELRERSQCKRGYEESEDAETCNADEGARHEAPL